MYRGNCQTSDRLRDNSELSTESGVVLGDSIRSCINLLRH